MGAENIKISPLIKSKVNDAPKTTATFELQNTEKKKFDIEKFIKDLEQGARFTVKHKYDGGYNSYTYSVTKIGEDFFSVELSERLISRENENDVTIRTFTIRRKKSAKSKSLEVWKKNIAPYKDQNYETFKDSANKGKDLSPEEAEEFWVKYNNSVFDSQSTKEVLEHESYDTWRSYAKNKQQRHYDSIIEETLPKTDFENLGFTPYTEEYKQLEA
ncbi:MAG: hypothetical protein M3Q34_02230 [bacterium]|nr:hypothetical protein [bacterium]